MYKSFVPWKGLKDIPIDIVKYRYIYSQKKREAIWNLGLEAIMGPSYHFSWEDIDHPLKLFDTKTLIDHFISL